MIKLTDFINISSTSLLNLYKIIVVLVFKIIETKYKNNNNLFFKKGEIIDRIDISSLTNIEVDSCTVISNHKFLIAYHKENSS